MNNLHACIISKIISLHSTLPGIARPRPMQRLKDKIMGHNVISDTASYKNGLFTKKMVCSNHYFSMATLQSNVGHAWPFSEH